MHVYMLLTVVWTLRAVEGFSSGKVQNSCNTMEPQHKTTGQTSQAPFSISMNHTTFQKGDVIAGNHHCCVKFKYRIHGV
uniref:Reelin domain-containing protein n=1 Tax=Paramormyrops kingsleyae TaxID=1676925 RepID=A0A3B3S1Y4_9TELE